MSDPVRFDPPSDPAATLVMVLYGRAATALRALDAIRRTAGSDYEVVVVDNASPDGAGAAVRDHVEGAQVVFNERNLGYGAAVDVGHLHARGRYVAALNPDIDPEPGWLDALVAALDRDPRAGAATPLYTGCGGEVQEAGALLDADGRGYGYGDRLPRDHPALAFRRYVDYGSAAALLLRRAALAEVGGFDARYGVGYYEDADLGFAMRERGWLTVYEPAAVVGHLGQTSFDPATRRRQLAANRRTFTARFADQLRGRPALRRPPYDPHRELVVRDWWAPERFLVLDGDGTGRAVAAAVQRRRPLDRVTWLPWPGTAATGKPHPAPEPDRAPGAGNEVEEAPPAEPERWLAERRHHYSVVLVTAGLPADAHGAIDTWQPQALLRRGPGGPPGAGADELLASIGLLS